MKLITLSTILFLVLSCVPTKKYSELRNRNEELQTQLNNLGYHELSEYEFQQIVKNAPYEVLNESEDLNGTIEKKDSVLIVKNVGNCTRPSKVSQLNRFSGVRYYKFESSNIAGAKAMGFSGNISSKGLLIIQDFSRIGTIQCGEEEKFFGIGVRCYINVSSFNSKTGLDLPQIAASVEVGRSSCEYELATYGFAADGSLYAEGFRSAGSYNVESYAGIKETFSKIQSMLNKSNDSLVIDPIPVPSK